MGAGAVGQNLGYRIQDWRMLFHLLGEGGEGYVFLEDIDDVHLVSASDQFLIEQDKSSLVGNPLTDRAIDLWKTISNWVGLCAGDPELLQNSEFVFFTLQAFKGGIASKIHEASKEAEAQSIVSMAEKLVSSTPKEVDGYIQHCLTHTEIFKEIITRLKFESWQGDTREVFFKKFSAHPVEERHYEFLLRQLLGYVQDEVTRYLSSCKPARISRGQFNAFYTKICRQLNSDYQLPSLSKKPDKASVEEVLNTATLVRQLSLIHATEQRKTLAVTYFLRAQAERTEWAVSEGLQLADFDEFEEELVSKWSLQFENIKITQSDKSPIERGVLLHNYCVANINQTLVGRVVPSWYVPGSFYALSDDGETIGWHEDFKSLLAPETIEGGE